MTNSARRYCHDKSQTRLPFGARARDTIQVFTWLQPSSSAFLCLEEKPVSLSSARNNNFNSLSCDVRYCRLGEESKLFAFVGVSRTDASDRAKSFLFRTDDSFGKRKGIPDSVTLRFRFSLSPAWLLQRDPGGLGQADGVAVVHNGGEKRQNHRALPSANDELARCAASGSLGQNSRDRLQFGRGGRRFHGEGPGAA